MHVSSEIPALKLVVVGHVDHGKSTLIGRLLHETNSLPDGKAEAVIAMSERRGMPVEWAFVLDALQAERDQGITIDTTQIFFNTEKRNYVIIDAPGHKEFLKNMVSGAALSDAAVLVIDAKDGMQEQSRRHGYILHLLGVRQVAVVINKMDLADYREERFQELTAEIRNYLSELGLEASAIIPVSAREGQGLITAPDKMPWYQGPSLVQVLDNFTPPILPTERPLRFPVQDVYKFDERRIIAGRIESGRIRTGDTILISPSNKAVTVKSIESWNTKEAAISASAGQSVGITLSEQLFIERGQMISHEANAPFETNVFRARIFWLGHKPLEIGKRYKLKLATNEQMVEVQSIEMVIDVENLTTHAGNTLERNAIGEVTLRARAMLALDEFSDNPKTGRFVLVDEYDTVGGGTIFMEGYPDQRSRTDVRSTNITAVEHRVTPELRAHANGHEGGVLWLTGLSGAGKSTIAIELEQQLFAKGYQVYVLDGDNVRFGLSSDLGFAPEDRVENIRRVGEVAKLFASAGVLVITAFISPYRADRDRARSIAPDMFHEVYIAADVATCEGRDPKGLYKKARAGEIKEFTGISAPYEEPVTPEVTVETENRTVNESVANLMAYVEENFSMVKRNGGGS